MRQARDEKLKRGCEVQEQKRKNVFVAREQKLSELRKLGRQLYAFGRSRLLPSRRETNSRNGFCEELELGFRFRNDPSLAHSRSTSFQTQSARQ